MKLPRFQINLKYNFDEIYSYNTKIAHLDLPSKTILKRGKWCRASATHYNYARRFLEDTYGFQETILRLMYIWKH